MSEPTVVRAVREGKPCQLVQKKTPRGIPLCVGCLRPIAKQRREQYRGEQPLFCTGRCAESFAEWAAGQIYPFTKEPEPVAQGHHRWYPVEEDT